MQTILGRHSEKIVECRGNVQDYTAPQKQHMRETSTTVAALAANFNGYRTQLLMYNGLPGHGLQHFITEKDSEAVAKSAVVSRTSKLLIWFVKHIYEHSCLAIQFQNIHLLSKFPNFEI